MQGNEHLRRVRAERGIKKGVAAIPILGAAHALFWIGSAMSLAPVVGSIERRLIPVVVWLAVLAGWGVVSAWLAVSGRYATKKFLSLLPGLWLPGIPVTLTVVLLAASPALREVLLAIAIHTPTKYFVLLQCLRALAIGSVIKAAKGEIPPQIGYGVGIPETLFGLSALALVFSGDAAALSPSFLMVWNGVGALILLSMLFVLQLTLPGPLQLFKNSPDGRALFEFPLVMAPSLLATLFLIANVTHIIGLVLVAAPT